MLEYACSKGTRYTKRRSLQSGVFSPLFLCRAVNTLLRKLKSLGCTILKSIGKCTQDLSDYFNS